MNPTIPKLKENHRLVRSLIAASCSEFFCEVARLAAARVCSALVTTLCLCCEDHRPSPRSVSVAKIVSPYN
jgi:hypothetical protein